MANPKIFVDPKFGMVEFLAAQGRIFLAPSAAENAQVTGQTSYAATTPTFLFDVPSGTTMLPLFVNLTQAGTVAGGDISIRITVDNATRYSSSGSDITPLSFGGQGRALASNLTIKSGATASAGTGVPIFRAVTAADVSPAEGAIQGPYWAAEVPYFIEGPGSFLIYTHAGTTGPTWEYSMGWAEFPTGMFVRVGE